VEAKRIEADRDQFFSQAPLQTEAPIAVGSRNGAKMAEGREMEACDWSKPFDALLNRFFFFSALSLI